MVGKRPARAVEELEGTALARLDPEALFVKGAVMVTAQEDQVGECRLAPIGPVDDVMRVGESKAASGKAASRVADLQGPPQGGWYGPRPPPDVEDRAIGTALHLDHARIAGEPPGRFS